VLLLVENTECDVVESASFLFRKRLKILRRELGVTQEQFAERAKISYKVYQHIEAGRRPNPRLSTLEKLANGLGVGVAELFLDPEDLPDAMVKRSRAVSTKRE